MTTRLPRTRDFLDRLARQVAQNDHHREPASDYRLAHILNVTRATTSAWRTGKTQLGDESALKMAELLGEDPQFVLACIHAERAHNAGVRQAWEKIAAGAACALLILGFTLFSPPSGAVNRHETEIYIMRN
ncbi:MAG: hypothetical protein WBR15_10920 [Gammaproteobacteria bacterium]